MTLIATLFHFHQIYRIGQLQTYKWDAKANFVFVFSECNTASFSVIEYGNRV